MKFEMYNLHTDLCRPCDGICGILNYHRLRGRIKKVIDQTGVVVYQRLEQSVLRDTVKSEED